MHVKIVVEELREIRRTEAAESVYNAEWRKMITDRYGSPPEISFFETPVIVDNQIGKTILDAAE